MIHESYSRSRVVLCDGSSYECMESVATVLAVKTEVEQEGGTMVSLSPYDPQASDMFYVAVNAIVAILPFPWAGPSAGPDA